MTEATEVEVTQADEARALEIFNDALGDMSSFAEFGWPNYYDGALRTISVYLARHRQSSVPVQGEPVAWDDDEAFRQMHLLYNYSDDDSRQFTRWQMAVAMQHGQRHAPTERERVLLEALAKGGFMMTETHNIGEHRARKLVIGFQNGNDADLAMEAVAKALVAWRSQS